MEIITPRLVLRDFTPSDLTEFLAYHAEPAYAQFYDRPEIDPAQVRALMQKFIDWAAAAPRRNYQLAIVEPGGSPGPIGCCGVRTQGLEEGMAHFGIELAPPCWGRGLATEAGGAILSFAFRDLGIREIRSITITENVSVARLVARLGFTGVETRPGPGWMSERGWTRTEWRLGAAR